MFFRIACVAMLLLAMNASGCCWCRWHHHCGYREATEEAGAVHPLPAPR